MLVTRPVPFQYLLLHSLTDFHVLVPFNVNIRSHPLNEHQKHTTLLEGRELWLYHLDGEGLKPILLPWKYHKGRSMGLWAEYKNFTKFQFYTENVFKVIPFFVIAFNRTHTIYVVSQFRGDRPRMPGHFEALVTILDRPTHWSHAGIDPMPDKMNLDQSNWFIVDFKARGYVCNRRSAKKTRKSQFT